MPHCHTTNKYCCNITLPFSLAWQPVVLILLVALFTSYVEYSSTGKVLFVCLIIIIII